MSKQSKKYKNVLSLLDHTTVGLAYYSGRQAHRHGYSRYTPCELTENFGRAMHSVLLIAKRSRSNLRLLADKQACRLGFA